jgi:hypothetical protein
MEEKKICKAEFSKGIYGDSIFAITPFKIFNAHTQNIGFTFGLNDSKTKMEVKMICKWLDSHKQVNAEAKMTGFYKVKITNELFIKEFPPVNDFLIPIKEMFSVFNDYVILESEKTNDKAHIKPFSDTELMEKIKNGIMRLAN